MKKIKFNIDKLSQTELIEVANWIWPVFDSFSKVKSINDILEKISYYTDSVLTIIFNEKTEECIAFGITTTFSFEGKKILYRVGTIVGERYRSQGLYKDLVNDSLGEYDFLVVRTANPRVYKTISSFGKIFPTIPDNNFFSGRKEAKEIAKKLFPEVEDSFVLRDVYSNEPLRHGDSKKIKDNLILDYFNLKLNKNDAFVCVVKLP